MRPTVFLWISVAGALLAQASAMAQTPPPAFTTQVQNSSAGSNEWRSPTSSLDEFPLLGAADCSRYGADYGYPECAGIVRPPAQAEPEAAAPPPLPAAGTNAEQPPVTAPVPLRRSAALKGLPTLSDISPASPLLPIEQRIAEIAGDLLLARFEGQVASDLGVQQAGAALKAGAIAGVLIRAANIADPAQLRDLTGFLKAWSDTPTVILAERPGGVAPEWAAERGFKPLPAPAEIGALADALDAFKRYQEMAAEMASVGINLNLGPSAEPCATTEDKGCFGSTPLHVAAFAIAFNFGHQDARVLTALRGLRSPDKRASLEAMRDMVRRSAPDALVITLPAGDDAAFDTAAGQLRAMREAGFTGVVIAELPGSGGAADSGEATVRALVLGADMVLSGDASSGADFNDSAVRAMTDAVQSNRIAMSRIEDAHARAAQLRDRLRAWAGGDGDVTSSTKSGR